MSKSRKRKPASRSKKQSISSKRTPKPLASGAGWWDQLTSRTRHFFCIGFLVVVALGFFAPVNFGSKQLAGSDIVQWRAMAESMLDYRDETGEEPLWATHLFSGMPGYMIAYRKQIPQLDFITQTLRKLAWPTFQLILLLLGGYGLIYYLTRNHWAGLLAAIAFGLTSSNFVILGAGHTSKFIALSFLPWTVWAFVHVLRKPKVLSGLLFAVVLALELRAGHIQITYFIAYLLIVWWGIEGIRALRSKEAKTFGMATVWLGVGAVLALLMVAQPYWVQVEYKAYTMRGMASGGGAGGLGWDYAMNWSQGIGEMLTYLIANVYGGGGAEYWGPKLSTAGPHYLGGIVLVLVLLALWKVRTRTVWALGIGAGLMMLFSFGSHAEFINRFMFNYVPLFNAFRAPEIWLHGVELALALLGGFGLFYLMQDIPDVPASQKAKSVYIAFGVGLAIVLLLWSTQIGLPFERDGEVQQIAQQIASRQQPPLAPNNPQILVAAQQYIASAKADREDAFNSDAMRTFIFLLLAGLFIVLYFQGRLPRWVMGMALILLVTIDLWGVGKRYMGDRMFTNRNPEAQIPTYGFDTFIKQKVEEAGGLGHFRTMSFESNPTQNARPAYHYEISGGYHAAKLRVYQDYIDHILLADGRTPSVRGLDLTSTRYLVARSPLPGTNVVYQDEQTGLMVLERPTALPRAFLVGEVETIAESEATWKRLNDPFFDPRQKAVLVETLDEPPTPIDSTSTTEVTLQKYTPREIVWEVNTDAQRVLVATEIYYPAGWKAFVDDIETPIYQTNYLFRGVSVPAGKHVVTMRFNPERHQQSLWVSGLATLLVYGSILLLLGMMWKRKEE